MVTLIHRLAFQYLLSVAILFWGAGCGSNVGSTGTALTGVTKIALGNNFGCAIINDGTLKCWGNSLEFAMGDGADGLHMGATTATLAPAGITDVSIAVSHTCVVANGSAYCWGENDAGELGNDSAIGSGTPVLVQGLGNNVSNIFIGQSSSCAIESGALFCWGANWSGTLGDGTTTARDTATAVLGLGSSVTHASTLNNSCAVRDGAVKCWGIPGYYGGLLPSTQANPTYPMATTPYAMPVVTSGVTKVATNSTHSCAIKSGIVYCWGLNNSGELGDGTYNDAVTTPVAVSTLTDATDITTGVAHACAIANNEVYCWGENESGQLGTGGTGDSPIPVRVEGVSGATQVVAGPYTTCALVGDTVKCWGTNSNANVGDGTVIPAFTPRSVVLTGTNQASSALPLVQLTQWAKTTWQWFLRLF